MKIANNIIKEHLKNVYFLCGSMVFGLKKKREEKHGFIRYRQGDHYDEYVSVASEKEQPAITLKIIEKHFGL